MKIRKIAVLTGAGISAESGLKTFRDDNGLWEGHDVTAVATPEGWAADMDLVLDFYNQRRRQLKSAQPNAAHLALVKLEKEYDVTLITQNVDDLHERAGSSKVIHLHGELLKARSSVDENLILDWTGDILRGDLCKNSSQLRPHVVWFGEAVPLLDIAAEVVAQADYVIIVGTSMQVYPAAGLVDYAKKGSKIYFIDPDPQVRPRPDLELIAKKAGEGVPIVIGKLLQNT